MLKEAGLWAVADAQGAFVLKNISPGKYTIEVVCMGYITYNQPIDATKNIKDLSISLQEENLTLEGAVVTAKESSSSTTTTRTIDKTALDHLQVNNISDISALLPGGSTASDNRLTSNNTRFEIRSGGESSIDNASFATGVEINGVRLSNNASFSDTKGVGTRNIATSNVESVEVISGVPSVEYGDMSSGMVIIKTRKGKTPFILEAKTNRNTKQISFSKGFSLGAKGGVLNIDLERVTSVHETMSPYNKYTRNAANIVYSNTFFQRSATPLQFSFSVAGNLGGLNNKADPDAFKDTYTIENENNVRGNITFNWLLNKSWITNAELKASVNYSDNLSKENVNKSSAAASSAIHGTEEGYFVGTAYEKDHNAAVIMRPAGYWYELSYIDSKPIDIDASLKLTWVRNFGKINNKVKIGAEFKSSGNLGKGHYYDNYATAPDWQPWPYNEIPFINTISAYAEESITLPVSTTSLMLTAGVRGEWTQIKKSEYGTVSSVSPRFSGKWSFIGPDRGLYVKNLSLRGGWGVAVKLPSFEVLYPQPTYPSIQTFASTTSAEGNAFYAYYIQPTVAKYNPNLQWQRNHQTDLGVEIEIPWVKLSLSGYYNKTLNAYQSERYYSPFSYNIVPSNALSSCPIPASDRSFSVDKTTGIVTVADMKGKYPSMTLDYINRNRYVSGYTTSNSKEPIVRKGIEWVADFGKIKAISTSFRLDGNYYVYRGINTSLLPYYRLGTFQVDGQPTKYIGYYYGTNSSSNVSNGQEKRSLKTNLTITTHIPKVRLIVSLRIEATLLNRTQNLSEGPNGTYAHKVVSGTDFTILDENIYDGNGTVAAFPVYYESIDNPGVLMDFAKDFEEAKKTPDTMFYSELAKLIRISNTKYFFAEGGYTPYWSANINITKEIGDIASISFNAVNFLNNISQVRKIATGELVSLLDISLLPTFYYGLSVRLKF